MYLSGRSLLTTLPQVGKARHPVERGTGVYGLSSFESVSHAAKRADVSPGYLYRLIRAGKFPSYEVGGKLMVLKQDTNAYISIRKAS